MKKLLSLLAVMAVATALLLAGTAQAAKTSGQISLPVGQLHWGDTVTFAVSTENAADPFVNVVCSAGYNSWAPVSNPTFILASGGWTSGAADCTASLVDYVNSHQTRTLAQVSFHVEP